MRADFAEAVQAAAIASYTQKAQRPFDEWLRRLREPGGERSASGPRNMDPLDAGGGREMHQPAMQMHQSPSALPPLPPEMTEAWPESPPPGTEE